MTDDDRKWRNRLLVMALLRLGGLAVAILGVAIFYTDVLRDGGWPQVGALLIVLGAIDSVVAPMLIKKRWDKEDRAGQ